jgi:hypothetical protein
MPFGSRSDPSLTISFTFHHKAFPGAVVHQLGLPGFALDLNDAHLRALHGFADGLRIGRIVLAALAAQPIRGDELRGDQPHPVAVPHEQPRPVARTGTRFHADQARRQRGDQFMQLVASDRRTHLRSATGLVDAVDGKNVLGEIDASGNNGHGLPLSD